MDSLFAQVQELYPDSETVLPYVVWHLEDLSVK